MKTQEQTQEKASERQPVESARDEIDDAYIRTYSDSGQVTAYVEWSDGSRTEGNPNGIHMTELIRRAKRDGIEVRSEIW